MVAEELLSLADNLPISYSLTKYGRVKKVRGLINLAYGGESIDEDQRPFFREVRAHLDGGKTARLTELAATVAISAGAVILMRRFGF